MKDQTIKIKIQNGHDREAVVIALANAGYKVWVQEEELKLVATSDYYVLFELKGATP